MIQKMKNGFMSLNMSKKMCIVFCGLMLLILFLFYGVFSNMYRDDMEENTMELFEQTSYLYEEKMGRFLGLIEGNDTII